MDFPFRNSSLDRGTDRKAPIPYAAMGKGLSQSKIIAHPEPGLTVQQLSPAVDRHCEKAVSSPAAERSSTEGALALRDLVGRSQHRRDFACSTG